MEISTFGMASTFCKISIMFAGFLGTWTAKTMSGFRGEGKMGKMIIYFLNASSLYSIMLLHYKYILEFNSVTLLRMNEKHLSNIHKLLSNNINKHLHYKRFVVRNKHNKCLYMLWISNCFFALENSVPLVELLAKCHYFGTLF